VPAGGGIHFGYLDIMTFFVTFLMTSRLNPEDLTQIYCVHFADPFAIAGSWFTAVLSYGCVAKVCLIVAFWNTPLNVPHM
jgi:hypothetical protein